MNRKIKFRAWETISKSMMFWKELLPHIGNIFNSPKQNNIILMQYTGLKDKNGKEIYEGDIYKTNGYSGVGVIKWDNKMSMWSFVRYEDESIYNFEEIEVIGNIYENKKLLK